MKKILLAFDGIHFSGGAFDFARRMNELNPVLLTGIFLPQAEYANFWSYGDALTAPLFIPYIANDEDKKVEENTSRFESLCQKHGIEYRVHIDSYDFALPELKKETRFADLLVIGSETFYNNLASGGPDEYLQDTLHGMECPMIVVPENLSFPETNILCYDGGESSVYAIKQFAYLFPELAEKPTLLVFVNKEEGEHEIPDEINIEELTTRHYPDLTITKLNMESKKYFNNWLSEKKGAIVICGSYGRSLFSRLLRKSFISGIIKDHLLPVFITHK